MFCFFFFFFCDRAALSNTKPNGAESTKIRKIYVLPIIPMLAETPRVAAPETPYGATVLSSLLKTIVFLGDVRSKHFGVSVHSLFIHP
uniref:Putative secreted protein n=1 Tax=Rhipicephalus microplus TaxID=6941 RepID=A0A6M2DB50_RHIMP